MVVVEVARRLWTVASLWFGPPAYAVCASTNRSTTLFFSAFPPAWLVGSTTATRTAFRVLWRPIRAAISVNFCRLCHVSGLIEREFRDASIKPLTGGSRAILTKIVVFPLGCPDTLVWGARAAKFPRDRLRCPTRWLGRPEPNFAFIGGVFGPTRVHVENADHT